MEDGMENYSPLLQERGRGEVRSETEVRDRKSEVRKEKNNKSSK
jgi:hypothetical protein